jgi:hypothetical protein
MRVFCMRDTTGHFGCYSPGVQCANDTLQLTERDTSITMRAFVVSLSHPESRRITYSY